MALKGVKVNGTAHQFDYEYLANKPAATTGLPTVTTTDEGKFLRVNAEGEWVAVALTNAEEGSF